MVYQDIADKCGVSLNSVHHTIVRYEETGDIRERKSPGRPKSTSKRDDIKRLRLSKADPLKSLRKLYQERTANGAPIGKITNFITFSYLIRQNLKKKAF
jgi:transposase